MWLNQQTFDAIRILLHLAERAPHLSRAADAAQATGVTLMNVQKTVHALGDTGLIEAVRGRHGGVRLGRPAEAITLAAIVRTLEPKDCPADFLAMGATEPRVAEVLFRAHRGFFRPLEDLTLADLLKDVRPPPPQPAGPPAAAGTAPPPVA
jgi:Rrf2 family protein